jgi:hypothetical protein
MLLDSVRHADLALQELDDLGFARASNAIPINLIEFPLVARNYPIGFLGEGEELYPVAIVGLQADNLFVDGKGRWKPNVYIPAYVRRYPFIFAENTEATELSLCLDDSPKVISKKGGKKLFESGKPTEVTERALEFCKSYHAAALATRPFSKALVDAGLLVERQANAELKTGGSFVLNGFKTIDEEKLRAVSAKTLGQWNAQNWLLPIYTQIESMLNWGELVDLMAARKEAGID